ncbi:MAG: hypothetical protein H6654_10170 [Ardenticatenaceae bacterium]|nr:hypothetical protein [Anaerolineales bacterium]MCB8938677.1 hypothetical protein [Ardenticatenaceae bacterium]MCB8973913.1 hypothetical protein [Ardenticatenaceae bacterium]
MNSYVKFNYLYRDAGNYKSWGELIFSNPDNLDLIDIDIQLRLEFIQEIFFVAHQINVPEIFLYTENSLNEDDHCFHEYNSVENVELFEFEPDKRSIKQFLEQIDIASNLGWKAFNPLIEITKIRDRSYSLSK